jgi:hypothetical protein
LREGFVCWLGARHGVCFFFFCYFLKSIFSFCCREVRATVHSPLQKFVRRCDGERRVGEKEKEEEEEREREREGGS